MRDWACSARVWLPGGHSDRLSAYKKFCYTLDKPLPNFTFPGHHNQEPVHSDLSCLQKALALLTEPSIWLPRSTPGTPDRLPTNDPTFRHPTGRGWGAGVFFSSFCHSFLVFFLSFILNPKQSTSLPALRLPLFC